MVKLQKLAKKPNANYQMATWCENDVFNKEAELGNSNALISTFKSLFFAIKIYPQHVWFTIDIFSAGDQINPVN